MGVRRAEDEGGDVRLGMLSGSKWPFGALRFDLAVDRGGGGPRRRAPSEVLEMLDEDRWRVSMGMSARNRGLEKELAARASRPVRSVESRHSSRRRRGLRWRCRESRRQQSRSAAPALREGASRCRRAEHASMQVHGGGCCERWQRHQGRGRGRATLECAQVRAGCELAVSLEVEGTACAQAQGEGGLVGCTRRRTPLRHGDQLCQPSTFAPVVGLPGQLMRRGQPRRIAEPAALVDMHCTLESCCSPRMQQLANGGLSSE